MSGAEGLRTMSLERLADALAAATPAPGGSCAAAIPGVLAAGLVAMSARLSAQGDPFGDLAYEMESVASEADQLRVQLLDLIDEGAEAFDRVVAARRLPDDAEVQRAYVAAVDPPRRVCSRSLRVLGLAAEVAKRGNPHAATDAGVAALLAASSVEAAALSVETEAGPVEDEGFRTAAAREAAAARSRAAELRDSALAAVRASARRPSRATDPELHLIR
jgi:methenyltetrahydrofolate cyclohydrolase